MPIDNFGSKILSDLQVPFKEWSKSINKVINRYFLVNGHLKTGLITHKSMF